MSGLEGIVSKIEQGVLNPLFVALIAVSSLIFIWGIIQTWVLGGEDPDKIAEGKRHIVWGIVGLVIIISAFGIINLIKNTIAP